MVTEELQINFHPSFFQTSKSKILTFSKAESDIICVKEKKQSLLFFPKFFPTEKTFLNAVIKSNLNGGSQRGAT